MKANLLALLLIALFFLVNAAYRVSEVNQAIITQFGEGSPSWRLV